MYSISPRGQLRQGIAVPDRLCATPPKAFQAAHETPNSARQSAWLRILARREYRFKNAVGH
jgi:hypothetical protein